MKPTLVLLSLAALLAAGPAFGANVTWNVAGDGVWDTTTANWTGDSTTYTDGDNVTFNNVPAESTYMITVLGRSPASTTVDVLADAQYTFVSEDPSTGGADSILTGTLVKNGAGLLQLGHTDLPNPWESSNYQNLFSTVTVNAGELRYCDTDAFGEATVTMAGGSTLRGFSRAEGRYGSGNEDLANPFVLSGGLVNLPLGHGESKDIWFDGVISGSGGFHLTGTHRQVTFAQDNTFEGGVILESNPDYANSIGLAAYGGLGTGTLTARQNVHTGSGGGLIAKGRGKNNFGIHAGAKT